MDHIVINLTFINVYFLSFKEVKKGNKLKITGFDKDFVRIYDVRRAFSKYGTVLDVKGLREGCVVTFSDKATADKALNQRVEVSI